MKEFGANHIKIRNIWQETLSLDDDQIEGDFFILGGTSLLAMHLLRQVKEVLNIECSLKDFFRDPTLTFLFSLIEDTKQPLNHCEDGISPAVLAQKHFPLSFAQDRLWFIEQLYPQVGLYNDAMIFELSGKLDIKVLEKAIQLIQKRHEVLQTKFLETSDGDIVQVIDQDIILSLENIDLSDLSENLQEHSLNKVIEKNVTRPFNLLEGPLIHYYLIRLSKDKHMLLITLHHIISDGWSMKVLCDELSELYSSQRSKRQPNLNLLAVQYKDFCQWQKTTFTKERVQKQLAYWSHKLSGTPEVSTFPTDYQRPNELSYEGGASIIELDASLVKKLKQFTGRERVSTFMVLLSVITSVLSRYSGQDDVVIGSPIANRHYPKVQDLIGFFANTVALRAHITEKMTFLDLVHQIKETLLDAYEHQDIPFDQVVDLLNVSRQLNQNPLFQVSCEYASKDEHLNLNLEKISSKHVILPSFKSKFDVSFYIFEFDEKILIKAQYSKDLYRGESLERILSGLTVFLAYVLDDPSEHIKKINILSKAEQQKLLVEWNATEVACPEDKTFIDLFEEQVAENPDNVALIFGEEELTYRELERKSREVAQTLRNKELR
ncbi:MAG: AMP-binding protein, partial [Chlamydiae bacterium]|nr:AMP-binding protein [Chlamydiota bacterium]